MIKLNEVEMTLREINNTIGYYRRKKIACEEAIKKLEEEREELRKKYNLGVD